MSSALFAPIILNESRVPQEQVDFLNTVFEKLAREVKDYPYLLLAVNGFRISSVVRKKAITTVLSSVTGDGEVVLFPEFFALKDKPEGEEEAVAILLAALLHVILEHPRRIDNLLSAQIPYIIAAIAAHIELRKFCEMLKLPVVKSLPRPEYYGLPHDMYLLEEVALQLAQRAKENDQWNRAQRMSSDMLSFVQSSGGGAGSEEEGEKGEGGKDKGGAGDRESGKGENNTQESSGGQHRQDVPSSSGSDSSSSDKQNRSSSSDSLRFSTQQKNRSVPKSNGDDKNETEKGDFFSPPFRSGWSAPVPGQASHVMASVAREFLLPASDSSDNSPGTLPLGEIFRVERRIDRLLRSLVATICGFLAPRWQQTRRINSKIYIATGLPLPRWRFVWGKNIGIVVDTSGSMIGALVRHAISLALGAGTELDRVWIVPCDVEGYRPFTPKEFNGQLIGMGGTYVWRGVETLYNRESYPFLPEEYDLILIITDGMSFWPSKEEVEEFFSNHPRTSVVFVVVSLNPRVKSPDDIPEIRRMPAELRAMADIRLISPGGSEP